MKTKLVINLIAGPGAAKSTITADLFALMKWNNLEVEMALEYAKDKVWEKSFHTLSNQIYVFGKQHHKLFRLSDQVDFIITDSPLLLSIYYARLNNCSSKAFETLVIEEYNKFNNLNIFVNRVKRYNPNGRMQTIDEAKKIDDDLLYLLDEFNLSYWCFDGNMEAKNKILEIINILFKKD